MAQRRDEIPQWWAKFGKRLAAAIKETGCNRQEFAAKLGVSDGTLGNWMRGAHLPNAEDVQKIAALTQKPIEYYYGAESQHREEQQGPAVQPTEFVTIPFDEFKTMRDGQTTAIVYRELYDKLMDRCVPKERDSDNSRAVTNGNAHLQNPRGP